MIPNQRDRKACVQCTRTKRRCDKALPACRRCLEKAVICQYPSTRRYSRPPAAPQNGAVDDRAFPLGVFTPEASSSNPGALCASNSPESLHTRPTPGNILESGGDQAETGEVELLFEVPSPAIRCFDGSWFLDTDTWAINHISIGCGKPPIHISTLKRWIEKVRDWLQQWVREGSNQFIHKQLYFHTGLPPCLQDAWATLTAYFAKTNENEDVTMEIVQSRARGLMSQQVWENDSLVTVPLMDTMEHLARVQALFIYQFIRLFDGCIRQRALAEKEIPFMSTWCEQLWQSAKLDLDDGGRNPWRSFINDENVHEMEPIARLWRPWILSESIRRTWLITNSMQAIFLTLRDGYAACPGGLPCTARQGLWDATSSSVWAKLVQENDPIFITCQKADEMFSRKASEVDSFAMLSLQTLWGTERVEEWASRP